MITKSHVWVGVSLSVCLLSSPAFAQGAPPELPAGAKAGQCYTRVLVPARFDTTTEKVLKREASAKIEVKAPRYEWVEERVLVREASKKLEVVPAKYETVTEDLVVKPASFRLEQVPAQYEWKTEKVQVEPARTVWKKGRGPVEKVDHTTGEIMCLVEEPARYETVKRRVLKSAATTRKIEIPAKTKKVSKRVLKTAASTREVEIPAEYKKVRVQKLVEPAKEVKTEIPAEYTTVTKRKMVSDAKMEWREILCETNIRPNTIQALQRALKTAGHSPGPIDGVVGRDTLAAVRAYQAKKGLPQGGLTMATLDSLGVDINR